MRGHFVFYAFEIGIMNGDSSMVFVNLIDANVWSSATIVIFSLII